MPPKRNKKNKQQSQTDKSRVGPDELPCQEEVFEPMQEDEPAEEDVAPADVGKADEESGAIEASKSSEEAQAAELMHHHAAERNALEEDEFNNRNPVETDEHQEGTALGKLIEIQNQESVDVHDAEVAEVRERYAKARQGHPENSSFSNNDTAQSHCSTADTPTTSSAGVSPYRVSPQFSGYKQGDGQSQQAKIFRDEARGQAHTLCHKIQLMSQHITKGCKTHESIQKVSPFLLTMTALEDGVVAIKQAEAQTKELPKIIRIGVQRAEKISAAEQKLHRLKNKLFVALQKTRPG